MEHPPELLTIGLVGAGKRVQDLYADILLELQKKFPLRLAGITNRTPEKAQALALRLQCPFYSTLEELLQKGAPDALIVALPPGPKDAISLDLLKRGKHIFLETPAAWHVRQVQAMERVAKQKRLVVEIAEDAAFAPEATLHRTILQSGLLGRVTAVFNEGQEHYYHALARLHVLMGDLPSPLSYRSSNSRLADRMILETREIAFQSGLRYFSRYSNPMRHSFRYAAEWKVLCEKGIMTDDRIVWKKADGAVDSVLFHKEGIHLIEGTSGQLHRLSITLAGQKFEWASPYSTLSWTRQQMGIATLLEGFIRGILEEQPVRYGIHRAVQDIRLWRAMEILARGPALRAPAAVIPAVLL